MDKKIVDELRKAFPNGHPDFLDITFEELDLHDKKNYDYAHGGNPLGNFDRVANIFSNYPNLKLSDPRVVAIGNAMKQIDSVLWQLNQGYEGKVEGIDKRCEDIHVYFKLVRIIDRAMRCKDEGGEEVSR